MKKTLLFAALAVLGLGAVGCSSDDSSSKQYHNEIQGEWVEVKTLFLDKDRKVIAEEIATDNEGCGFDEVEFKGNILISKSPFRLEEGADCRVETEEIEFTLSGRIMTVQIQGEEEIEEIKSTIIEVSASTLTIESSDIDGDFPDEVKYIQTKHSKKVPL
ncbi:hypothetical protein [Myroides odoratus]|uniref:Lipocalin-like domain-containing protein n=1 Tax=Myroides odoratus TaxID=256 RepID=A0A378RM76_MYROD|nr:hypothetical protein [Myroides odoratus]QQU05133.1 hypothetical protein I6I89_07595 [Myroides odoratus]STZ27381.1 Uncharacterised protein [Myroides odoratus]